MTGERKRVLLAGVLMVVAVAAIWRAVEPTHHALAALDTCTASAGGDWAAAIAASDALPKSGHADEALLGAVSCRCDALEATGQPQSCHALLDDWLMRPGAETWLPEDVRLAPWMVHAQSQGRMSDVAVVADRRHQKDPGDPAWTFRAFSIQLAAGDESRVFTDLKAQLPSLPPASQVAARQALADSAHRRGDIATEYTLYAEGAPPTQPDERDEWFYARVTAAALSGDLGRTRESRDVWLAAGGNPGVVACGYATALSIASVLDPDKSWTVLLEEAVATPGAESHQRLLGTAYMRLLGQLALDGDAALALKYADEAKRRVPGFDPHEGELSRMATLQSGERANGGGTLRFSVAAPPEGAELWVSPDRGSAPESAWTRVAMPDGRAELPRGLDATPVRWVYRTETTTYGSGTTWPAPGNNVDIGIDITHPTPRQPQPPLTPGRPADGHRRVWVVILDCGDWRITSYLRQRGELPNFDALLRTGWRAAPFQLPAYTAAAMDALTHPVPRTSATVIDRVHQLGIELGGLSSIGKNPFEPLAFFLPAQRGLFDTLGMGDLRSANLLFSHGNIDAGRNAEVAGPQGAHSVLPLGRSLRPLTEAEVAAFPEFGPTGEYQEVRDSMQTMAAQFDTIAALMSGKDADNIFFRVEGLDPLTHAGFAATTEARQDDGHVRLFSVYRYIDARLGDLTRALDGDDMLIVMSDHGIETSMVHHPIALFVAWGNGVPTGRLTGRPAVRGVSRAVAEALGVETTWPDYGILPWAADWRAGTPITMTTAAATFPVNATDPSGKTIAVPPGVR